MNRLEVLATGPLTTVQDAGRRGYAALGVPWAGALDRASAATANRLLGQPTTHAVLESLLGGLEVRLAESCWVAVTGATAPVEAAGRAVAWGQPVRLPADAVLRVGTASQGARTYLAVAGGIEVEPVLGSRSTDTLSGLGPSIVRVGDVLPVGAALGVPADGVALPPRREPVLPVHPGPHADRFAPHALDVLLAGTYVVAPDSDRVGLRLLGDPLPRRREAGELPSEGMVLGAVQVPPDGGPVVFLADHPTTGGYPVVGVVDPAALDACGQLLPGDRVRFSRAQDS